MNASPPSATRRFRFAPSPSGFLHVGGVRTALFNWLLARKHGGHFVLRIEDTDGERSSEESIQTILDALTWLGLQWDEGPGVGGPHGPYQQSQRSDAYTAALDSLLDSGKAYPCTCTREELDTLRAQARADGTSFQYPGTCRGKTRADLGGAPHVLRLRTPDDGAASWDDAVVGKRVYGWAELGDFVIARQDGSPLYNFAVVVDDSDMGITDVVRGADHIDNTPKQILLYQALGLACPRFAHVPLIFNASGSKMSKRDEGANALDYRAQGILPQAALNFLARLGWSHGDDEVFSLEELIEAFSLEGVGVTPGVLNLEKLEWLNGQHMQAASAEDLAAQALPFLKAIEWVNVDEERLAAIVQAYRARARTLKELAGATACYFQEGPVELDPKAAKKHLKAGAAPVLEAVLHRLTALPSWQPQALHQTVEEIAADLDLKMGKVAQPIRVALTGRAASPGIDETLYLMQRKRSLGRLEQARAFAQARSDAQNP